MPPNQFLKGMAEKGVEPHKESHNFLIWDLKFPYGVASGDVTDHSAVLWTSVNQEAVIRVEVSTDPDFSNVIYVKDVHTNTQDDYTGKVLVTGLQPDATYFYRWRQASTFSEIGSFTTAPHPSTVSTFRGNVSFIWTGNSDASKLNGTLLVGDGNLLNAEKNTKGKAPDFFVSLGDVIYDIAPGTRQSPDAESLDDYRQMYKDSRQARNLDDLLKSTSVFAMWDDHGAKDRWSGQPVTPELYEMRTEAFYEYMPSERSAVATDESECTGPPKFSLSHWGSNIDLIFLDTHSCRSPSVENVCHKDPAPTFTEIIRRYSERLSTTLPPVGCMDAINDPERTLLGATQKALLKKSLLDSTAKFKFIITPVPIQQGYVPPYDSWEDYGAERKEVLNFIKDNQIKNVIFLSNSKNLSMINEVNIDRFTNSTPIAYEFVTSSLTSVTDQQWLEDPMRVSIPTSHHTVAGIECLPSNRYTYGSVEIDDSNGIAQVSLKDHDGNIVHDSKDSSIPCTKSFLTPLERNTPPSPDLDSEIRQLADGDPSSGLVPVPLPLPNTLTIK